MGDGSLHLLLKGFVAFEAASYPDTWPKAQYRNPGMMPTLRLLLASKVNQNWTGELSLHYGRNQTAGLPAAEACRALSAHPSNIRTLLDIRVDLGPSPDPALDLVVHGWPRRVSLKAQLQQALASPPALTASSGPPLLVRALPYFFGTPADQAALLLDWSNQYHEPLGFDGTIAYVLPDDASALSAHPRIRALVAARRLTLFLWDQFSAYSVRLLSSAFFSCAPGHSAAGTWAACTVQPSVAEPVVICGCHVPQGWNYYDQQICIGHSSLSMWGRNALVLVGDIDEWFLPGRPRATLPQLLAPGGCLAALKSTDCISFARRDIYPYEQLPANGSAPDEPGLWRNASGGHPLRNYQFMSTHNFKPKTMSRPESVLTPGVRVSSPCIGKDTVANSSAPGGKLDSACGAISFCSAAPAGCALQFHVRNTFRVRRVYNTSRIQPAEWLWMLDERRQH